MVLLLNFATYYIYLLMHHPRNTIRDRDAVIKQIDTGIPASSRAVNSHSCTPTHRPAPCRNGCAALATRHHLRSRSRRRVSQHHRSICSPAEPHPAPCSARCRPWRAAPPARGAVLVLVRIPDEATPSSSHPRRSHTRRSHPCPHPRRSHILLPVAPIELSSHAFPRPACRLSVAVSRREMQISAIR